MQDSFEITINGHCYPVSGPVSQWTLLDFLQSIGFSTLRQPRGHENLGADSVILLDMNAWGRPAYRLVPSSLFPLAQAAQRTFVTVEALLASHPVHPVVEILRKHAPNLPSEAVPAIYLSFFEAWYRDGLESVKQVTDGYAGFGFRFGGFRSLNAAALELFDRVSELRANIAPEFELNSPEAMAALRMRGVSAASDPFDDAFSSVLTQAAPVAEPIEFSEPGGDQFYRAATLNETRTLRRSFPEAGLMHSGVASLRQRADAPQPQQMVSAEGASDLRTVMDYDGKIEIGGEASLTMLEESLSARFPTLAELIPEIEPRPIRNRLTITEHLVELGRPPVLALPLFLAEARLRIAATDSEHDASLVGFYRTRSESGLRANELVKLISVPRDQISTSSCRFVKVYRFGHLGAAGFRVEIDSDLKVVAAKAAFVGLDRQLSFRRAVNLESAVADQIWGEQSVLKAGEELVQDIDPRADRLAPAEHRVQLLQNAWRRFHREFRPREVHESRLPVAVPPPVEA